MSYLTKTSPMKCFCRAMKHVASLSSGNVSIICSALMGLCQEDIFILF